MSINLNQCKPGQKLRSKHGMVLTYVGKTNNCMWPHKVRYPDDSDGTRTDDGFVYSNPASRLPTDHDIVEILPDEPHQVLTPTMMAAIL